MRFIYWHICLISTCELIGICDMQMAFEGHICCWHICDSSIVNKSCSVFFVLLICAVMWGLCIDYSNSAVEHMYSVVCIFVQGNMTIM